MIELRKKDDCCGCHACYSICPVGAILMEEDERGFKYPRIDKNKCINCGQCEKVCPIINSIQKKDSTYNYAYAVNNKDEIIRKNSSSGGFFNLIATSVLDNDGVVFGAAFDENWQVKHIAISNKKNIEKLQTSKYTQSIIGDTYKNTKKYLDDGKIVLFTGTPCQIEGLKTFLKKDYDNLYTQDIICHGVPSPKVWKKYLDYRKKQDGKNPIEINFRKKNEGWNSFKLFFKYDNSNFYEKTHDKDLYFKVFLQNICLRDSCYNCSFKKWDRVSDITIGDFWGIDNVVPELNDNKGTSIVIINSKKGKKLFDSVKNKCFYKEVDLKESVQTYNYAYFKSCNKHHNTDRFFSDLDNMSFEKLVSKYLPEPSLIKKIIKKIKRIIKK